MKIVWEIDHLDIAKVQNFIETHNNFFMQKRRDRNVNRQNLDTSKDAILKGIIMCLLTSQQRSGPDTPISRFLLKKNFPFSYNIMLDNQTNIQAFIRDIMLQNGLKRYVNKIAKYFAVNFEFLERNEWALFRDIEPKTSLGLSREGERKLADSVQESFVGFGPKQARNLLQYLGLTRFEIPIDSRVTRWLNDFGFPVLLSSNALQDKRYYHFISDGIQNLCEKANVYPCLLDAAIFSSFDKNQWKDENIVF